MIIKASQRGGANKLAKHLLNANDNEYVEVHEVKGFISGNVRGAMNETYAISRGTKCRQPLFSVSLSPPANEYVPVSTFEEVASRIEEKTGLTGQPRLIILHGKEGRNHAHVIWSRIDSQKMKAINLPFFKNKMAEISKALYLEHGWQLPKGFIDRSQRNPLNFTLAEWQQAKKLGDHPKVAKAALQECWAISKGKQSFIKALDQRGYYLARGGRRGFVAVDWRGEVYSLSRVLGRKTKALKERLGDTKHLPSVEEVKAKTDQQLVRKIQVFTANIQGQYQPKLSPLLINRDRLNDNHHQEREQLSKAQEKRHIENSKIRQARIKRGLHGLWDRLTGKRKQLLQQNEQEAHADKEQNTQEQNKLNIQHLQERQYLQKNIEALQSQEEQALKAMRQAVFSKLPEKDIARYRERYEQPTPQKSRGPSLQL
ncbi:MAG: relaxase/mobilization nuclease domain-containing protein [Cellvibrionaceae bacterium]